MSGTTSPTLLSDRTSAPPAVVDHNTATGRGSETPINAKKEPKSPSYCRELSESVTHTAFAKMAGWVDSIKVAEKKEKPSDNKEETPTGETEQTVSGETSTETDKAEDKKPEDKKADQSTGFLARWTIKSVATSGFIATGVLSAVEVVARSVLFAILKLASICKLVSAETASNLGPAKSWEAFTGSWSALCKIYSANASNPLIAAKA